MPTNMNISSFNYYFEHLNSNSEEIIEFTKKLKEYANSGANKEHIYVIQSILTDKEYPYSYKDAIIILIPDYKILFLNFGNDNDKFNHYCQDVLFDLGILSKEYQYLQHIGRPRDWSEVIEYHDSNSFSIEDILNREKVVQPKNIRLIELLISLFIGSINDINKVSELTTQESTLDKAKKKVSLFDTIQASFLYEKNSGKRVVIQGGSGAGETNLLLHKLKELYTNNNSDKICFTCNNEILADNFKQEIKPFFNFMKVGSQIEWNKRLWCHQVYGSLSDIHSGAYRYICDFYNISFSNPSNVKDLSQACKIALEQIIKEPSNDNKYAFDYMLINESQDFNEKFFLLCERVTRNQIYVTGDMF